MYTIRKTRVANGYLYELVTPSNSVIQSIQSLSPVPPRQILRSQALLNTKLVLDTPYYSQAPYYNELTPHLSR